MSKRNNKKSIKDFATTKLTQQQIDKVKGGTGNQEELLIG